MNEHDLEHIIDRQLKRVPPRRAPDTLLPTVMRAVRRAPRRPWYTQPWFIWPAGWKAASLAALVLVLAGGAVLAPAGLAYVAPVVDGVQTLMAPAARVVAAVETVSVAVEIVSRVIGQSVLGLVIGLFVVMLTTSVIVGAAISRVAFGEAYQS